MSTLLIVDDEPNVLNALRRMCVNPDAEPPIPVLKVLTFTSAAEALQYVTEHAVDLVISDYRMPEMDGAAFLTRVRELQPFTARIILSAYTDVEGILRAVNDAGIFQFIGKPWSDYDLRNAIAHALSHRATLVENHQLASDVRRQRGVISAQRAEIDRLELESPGITHVRWAEDGGVLLEE